MYGWDDESSEALFIRADSCEGARSWGREVAESFTSSLFRAGGWRREIPSWKESGFAHWVEEDPEAVFSSDVLKAIPEVREGEMPTFSEGRIV